MGTARSTEPSCSQDFLLLNSVFSDSLSSWNMSVRHLSLTGTVGAPLFVRPGRTAELPGGAMTWDGTQFIAVFSTTPMKLARFGASATDLELSDLGRMPATQQTPGAARVGATTLVAFDGSERSADGYVRSLQALRLDTLGAPIDQQSIRIAIPPNDFYGERAQVVAGPNQFFVSWIGNGFTSGPESVGAAQLSLDGVVSNVLTLDASDGGRGGPYEFAQDMSSAFDGERFAVSWRHQRVLTRMVSSKSSLAWFRCCRARAQRPCFVTSAAASL